MKKPHPVRLVLLCAPLLLTACGTIGDARSSYELSQYNASPAGIAERQAREAAQAEDARIAREKRHRTCRAYQADWRKAGYDIGAQGGNPHYYQSILRDCDDIPLTFSQKPWDSGFKQGLKDRWCLYETALYIGPEYAFDELMKTCSPLLSERQRRNMDVFYAKGRIMAQQKSDLKEAEQRLAELENQLRYQGDSETGREARREYPAQRREVRELTAGLAQLQAETDRLLLETGGR